ncbi:unnamed protein product [Ceratitis capitata]|uniref:(Mediterranean fruit fly) hypothetical protein n=1 Tax=Ceratitis capitata TaxID=7213 RepID=A0A811UNX4_CERCA|nr:unnamed protein product [Ceratitis capitata]
MSVTDAKSKQNSFTHYLNNQQTRHEASYKPGLSRRALKLGLALSSDDTHTRLAAGRHDGATAQKISHAYLSAERFSAPTENTQSQPLAGVKPVARRPSPVGTKQ